MSSTSSSAKQYNNSCTVYTVNYQFSYCSQNDDVLISDVSRLFDVYKQGNGTLQAPLSARCS